MTAKTLLALALLGALASVAGNAGAAAFQLKEKSAKGLGRAFAGSISAPGDASVIADNPAAMRLLDGRVFQADASVVNYTIDFKGQGRDTLGRPQSGGDGGDAGDTSPVPALYFHTPLGDHAHLGLSVTAPFGFKTEYDSNWMGRYNGIKTEIKAVDLGLSLSYDVNPYVSLGASVFVERAEAELYDAVDFGAVLAGARAPGFAPGSADGYTRIEAKDDAVGFTLGGLFTPVEGTNIGIAYRSKVDHKLNDADISFDVPASAAPLLAAARPGWFVDTQASTALNLPATLTGSISHQVNDRWTLMADVTRTGWSKFAEVRLDFDSAQPTRALDFGYRNTTFASIGAEYRYNEKLTLRAGLATDQSPVTDDTRDVRVPDTDRKWVSLGATYRASGSAEYSVGYTHLFLDEPEVSLVSATGSTLQGKYDVGTDIVAFSAAYYF